MKIVYCLNSIRYLGGIQRVTIVKANALAALSGNNVYIVVTDNRAGTLIHPLSPQVHLIDLDINYYEDDWKSKWNVIKGIIAKRREHKKRLRETLQKIQPDVVVSVGQSEKNMLPSIDGRWITIRELHFTKNYRMLHAKSRLDYVLALAGNWYDYRYKIKKYDHIVVLTHEDKETHWQNSKHVSVIPNPISFVTDITAKYDAKKIITVGRLSHQKNYSSLIRAFRRVADRHPDWTLEIYGEGEEKEQLRSLVNGLGLDDTVCLKGYTSNVQEKMAEASVFVLSSLFEGFGLVIVEAMSCGLPVVSYACPCGPKDIITDGVDGFLVPVNDEKRLADRLCRLIKDEELRMKMGKAALQKAKQYSIENIIPQWMELFNNLINEKRKSRFD